jgi:hypothetical protein
VPKRQISEGKTNKKTLPFKNNKKNSVLFIRGLLLSTLVMSLLIED